MRSRSTIKQGRMQVPIGQIVNCVLKPRGDQAAPSDAKRLTMEITIAQMNAKGAVTLAYFPFASALPAGAIPIAYRCLNLGNDVTSSGGAITAFLVSLISAEEVTALLLANFSVMNLAGRKAQSVLNCNAVLNATYPQESGWTPECRITLAGAGVNFGNLQGTTGIEVELLYWEP